MIDRLCKDIIERFNIDRFVETGTDKGETVALVGQWFATMDPDFGSVVGLIATGARSYQSHSKPIAYPQFDHAKNSRYQIHSVDLDAFSHQTAQANFRSNPNIVLHQGSSEKFLESFLAMDRTPGRNYLFFLDAHWGDYWPLRDEINVIRTLDKYAIIIDDFFVPGKSDPSSPHGAFGFDLYQGRVLHWSYVCDLFADDAVRVFYPSQPNRDLRGWVLIVKGYTGAQLEFLTSLGLFEVAQSDKIHTVPIALTWRSHFDMKNILKSIVPVAALRSMHRAYERLAFKLRI